ncbi:MAG: hypothetical protein AAGA90_16510 [Actinomycetota bacterium]
MHTPPLRILVLFVALVVAATGCRYETIDGVGTRTPDPDVPPQGDVTLTGCHVGEWSRWHASGVVVNRTEEVQTYEVTVGFYDADVRLAERAHWIRALRPGETAEIDRSWWIEAASQVDGCRLLTVNRFA